MADASRLRTTYALQEAGILDQSGRLTELAVENSEFAKRIGSSLDNSSVIKALTGDGSKLSDWAKMTTQSIELPNSQRIQVHYYKNLVTGKINYTHQDFKVKGIVNDLFQPAQKTGYEPKTVDEILKNYRNKR